MNNLTQFNTLAEYNDFIVSNICPYVNTSYIFETDEVKYLKDDLGGDINFTTPFTIEILSIGQSESSCRLFISPEGYESFKYKINNGEWTSTTEQYILLDNIVEGDKIQIIVKKNRANNNESILGELDLWRNESWDDGIGGDIKIYGNIMSCIVGDNYMIDIDLPEFSGGEYGYFSKLSSSDRIKNILVDAENLWMPYRNIPEKAYYRMFMNYTRLEKGPAIKAKTLTKNACQHMFMGCTSLTDMPIIAAEILYQDSCDTMFYGCTSLVNTTTLHVNKCNPSGCMASMFQGCTSLTTTPTWNETITIPGEGNSEFANMFDACTSLTDASSIHITINGGVYNLTNNMFYGCTSLVTGPYIEVNSENYYGFDMFAGCNELESITYLSNHNNFSFGLSENTKNGTWYYKDGVQYDPTTYVPATWSCQIYSE